MGYSNAFSQHLIPISSDHPFKNQFHLKFYINLIPNMNQKLILILCFLLAAQSAVIQTDAISKIATNIQLNTVVDTSKISATISDLRLPITQDADVYFGNVEINIESGEKRRIDFFGTFVPNNNNCSYSRCFYGWVDNYTISGEEPVIGFTNQSLVIKPVFEFKTNSEEDFVIIRHPNLAEQWVQIIEVLCQKVNPQITEKNQASQKFFATATDVKFDPKAWAIAPQDFSASTIPPTVSKIQEPTESLQPTYDFKTIQASDLKSQTYSNFRLSSSAFKLALGDRVATSEQKIVLDGFATKNSLFSENLVLSTQNVVKSRSMNYQFSLDSSDELSDKGEKIPDFAGFATLNFGYSQKIKTPASNAQTIRNLLVGSNRVSFDLNSINERRQRLPEIMDPQIKLVVDNGPTFEDAEVLTFNNEKFSGINVIDEFSKASVSSAPLTLSPGVLANLDIKRNLQLLQNYTVYNYKKVIINKSIFGKTFEADFEVKCYVLVYPSDHQIQCIGTFNYQLFGKVKSIPVFNFKKSVSFSWNWSKQYKGDWSFSIAIPLPPPVSFISITFSFKVSYVIDVKIDIVGGQGISPYVVKVNTLATTRVDTDASAGLRVVAIEGGVFISGTLLNAGTDPKVTLSYYFAKKYINILAQWYFWINAFNYKWGFYYKTWSLWSGWSGRKIIKQWTINGVYGKWAIVNKSWNVYL